MGRNRISGMWIEYVLIVILIIIVAIILYKLLGPYLQTQFTQFCIQNNLPCK